MKAAPRWDVVVVGAGPAGSTAATLLAQRGHRVLMLEKERFPRFHIGESLLPAGLPILDRLGVEPCKSTFIFKRGAEFVCEQSDRRQMFRFGDVLEGCAEHAWHVERSLFDLALRDGALAAGAEVRHGEAVSDVQVEPGHVRVTTASGSIRARFLVDASGQDRLVGRRNGTIEANRRFGAVSVFTHFDGLGDEATRDLGPGNEVRIMLVPGGWGWVIPLPGGRLSVGVVSKQRLTPDSLDTGLLAGPLVQRLTRGAERGPTRVTRNFSYRNTAPAGPRFAAVGDAAGFLDPIFSSGVTLAMRGAELLADRLGPALAEGTEGAPDLADEPLAPMDRANRTFAALIDRFYNSRMRESFFLGEVRGMPMYEGVLSVLAGDVWRHDNPFQELLLRARQRRVPAR
ncbi:MAG: NAD(P)/FAD-dependent oxidoreductase [Planctomycetota bacterium]|jgi:flavin-dependent dehydrogenase